MRLLTFLCKGCGQTCTRPGRVDRPPGYCTAQCRRLTYAPRQTVEFTCQGCQARSLRVIREGAPLPQYCTERCFDRRGVVKMRKYEFTTRMLRALRSAKQSGRGGIRRLQEEDARFAAIPLRVLRYHAQRYAPEAPRHGGGRWTAEEDALLQQGGDRAVPLRAWQRRLRQGGFQRSVGAIEQRLKLLGFVAREGEWNPHEVAQGLGVSDQVVRRWIDKQYLRASVRRGGEKEYCFITTKALRQCLRERPELVSAGRPDPLWLVSVLVTQTAPTGGAPADASGDWMNGAAVQDRAAAD